MKTFIGIMDAHGLESFLDKNDKKTSVSILKLRADSNIHRHAFVYQVELDDQQESSAQKLIDNKDWKQACLYLKSLNTFSCEKSRMKSARLVPNDDLDPF